MREQRRPSGARAHQRGVCIHRREAAPEVGTAHAALDGSVFEIAKDRRMPPASAISSLARPVLKKRLWHVGNVLLKMHNCLQLRGEFIALSPLLRKCFTRVKYILSDDINANVDENAILGERVDSSDDLATMATLEEEASAALAAQE